jgi:hypothetical protein
VPVEVWQQAGSKAKWRVEKPGRVVSMDGASTTLFIRPDLAYKLPHATQGAFDTDPLLKLANAQDMIISELRAAQAKGWNLKLTQETMAGGESKLVVTVETKAEVPENDHNRNKWFGDSDIRWVYRFDGKTHRLKEVEALLHGRSGDVLILEAERIEYDRPIDATIFSLALPKNVRWVKDPERLPDNAKYEKMTPLEAARAFFAACAKEDWNEAQKFETMPFDNTLREYLRGLQIMSLGQPFQSKSYPGWIIPYEIKFNGGHVKKHNLFLRKDNPAMRYVVDGGI